MSLMETQGKNIKKTKIMHNGHVFIKELMGNKLRKNGRNEILSAFKN